MKSAEEWSQRWCFDCDTVEKQIAQIQLDAWRQGMTDAAEIVNAQCDLPEDEIPDHSIKDNPAYTIGIRRGCINVANAIYSERNKLHGL